MKAIIYILVASFALLVIISGFVILNTLIEIYTVSNRIEDSIIASGWAGFSMPDLDQLAVRKNISNDELRNIYLDKQKAKDAVIDYIKINLKLDDSFHAKEESFITVKDNPGIIDEIEVYNPNDLPASCSMGVNFERTTIHIVVEIPLQVKFVGLVYAKKHIDVDTATFFKD